MNHCIRKKANKRTDSFCPKSNLLLIWNKKFKWHRVSLIHTNYKSIWMKCGSKAVFTINNKTKQQPCLCIKRKMIYTTFDTIRTIFFAQWFRFFSTIISYIPFYIFCRIWSHSVKQSARICSLASSLDWAQEYVDHK